MYSVAENVVYVLYDYGKNSKEEKEKNIMPYGLCCAIGSERENIIPYRKYLVLSLRGLFLRRRKKTNKL